MKMMCVRHGPGVVVVVVVVLVGEKERKVEERERGEKHASIRLHNLVWL